MNPVLKISDLNTTISYEPRVRDLLIAERLGMADLHKIRPFIEANRAELEAYGEVSARRAETTAQGGRPGTEYWLNEGQALVICALSRTPNAAAVRKALIDVYLEYRNGRFVPAREHSRRGATARTRVDFANPPNGQADRRRNSDAFFRINMLILEMAEKRLAIYKLGKEVGLDIMDGTDQPFCDFFNGVSAKVARLPMSW